MLASPSDFEMATSTLSPKTYTVVVTLTLSSDTQIQNIKKVYNEKMAFVDKQLSQEIKQY
jgi:hypothetical protein